MDTAGTYTIDIEGLTGRSTVVEPLPWVLVGDVTGGLLGILAVAAIAVYLCVFRSKQASA